MIDIRMIGSRVLVEVDNQTEYEQPSGIITVESHAPGNIGTALAVGPDVGSVKVGDVVLFGSEAGLEVEFGESRTLVMSEDEIEAVWDEEKKPE